MFGDFDFQVLRCFDKVEECVGCLDEVVELVFVCEKGKKGRTFGSIYRK